LQLQRLRLFFPPMSLLQLAAWWTTGSPPRLRLLGLPLLPLPQTITPVSTLPCSPPSHPWILPLEKKTQVASRKKPLDPALVAHSKSLNKDYLMLAQEYTNQSAYRCVNYTMRSQAVRLALLTSLTPLPPPRVVPTTVSPPASASCVLCKTNDVASVFFPCGHRCCCDACRLKNNIGTPAVQGSWNFCPICCAEIKLTLKRDGTEEDRYWKWVQEVR
jgi:hypothetical protein